MLEERRLAEAARLDKERLEAEARQRDRPSPLTAVAAIGATAAFIYSGPFLAVAAAGACLIGAGRNDAVGSALNTIGEAGADALMHARGFNREFGLTAKARDAARLASVKAEEVEDRLMTVAPTTAAALGTAMRGVKLVVENSPVTMALHHAIGDSERSAEDVLAKPRSMLERIEGKKV